MADSSTFLRRTARAVAGLSLAVLLLPRAHAQQPPRPHTSNSAQPFTIEQALSAPFATGLTAAPSGTLFAWVEDAEGLHNLWIGGSNAASRQLTSYIADDGQDISGIAWSPDASAIAYAYGADNGASGQPVNPAHLQRALPVHIFVQKLADGAPAVDLGEGRAPLYTRDGTLLFLRGGQIYFGSPSRSVRQMIYDRGSASGLTLSPDGKLLAYVSTRREPGHPSHSFIALYDLTNRTLRFVAPSTGVDFAPAFSPDGKQLAWLRRPFTEVGEFAPNRTSATPWSIQLCDLATNTTRTLYEPAANKPGSVLPRMSTGSPFLIFAANDRLLFLSDADNWVHLYSADTTSTKPPTRLTPGPYEVEDAIFDDRHSAVYFAANKPIADQLDADRRHIFKLDLTTSAPPITVTQGTGIETHPAVASDGTLAILSGSVTQPMHPALVAVSGAITPLNSDTPATYPGTHFITPTQALFTASDGVHLHGQLFLPPTPKPASVKRPALIFVHGGPKRQMLLGYPAMAYYSNAYAMNQYLVSRGFIVLSVNYRCGIGYGMEFRQCVHSGADGGTEYNDVLAAQKYLAARPDVDAKRIGIWGGSYGGYLTALALARNSDLFAAGVDFHGVHDWILEDNNGDWLAGSNAERDAIATKAHASSPLGSTARWRSPVLLIHGDDDPSVAYAQTPVLADQLRARNVHFEELIFPDEVHEFVLHKDWVAAYEAEAAFFERVLKP